MMPVSKVELLRDKLRIGKVVIEQVLAHISNAPHATSAYCTLLCYVAPGTYLARLGARNCE